MPPSYSTGRSFVGRVPRGADLLEAITRIANEASIGVATVAVHGVVERLALSVLDPGTRMPSPRTVDAQLEIGSLSGTVSFFKARALPRLSGVFVAHDGAIHAGTLARGTVVYACEVVITELVGAKLSRDFDPETGLALWKASSLLISPEHDAPGDQEPTG